VIISNNLNWEQHINTICLKASFLKLLKRSSMSSDDLIHYFKSIVRPVLEYACPVWQLSITTDQCNQPELIQKRALYIIYVNDPSTNYQHLCELLDIDTVSFRLDLLARKFLTDLSSYSKAIQCPHSILHSTGNRPCILSHIRLWQH
jgi:hypothetical protein